MATISMSGTTKQKPCLYYKGHSYIKDRPTSTKTYWRYVNYLKDYCHSRRKPLFTIDFWNMFYRTGQSLMRTNNSAEAYHRRINSIFQCSHPTLWVFLQKLIDEQNGTHADIAHIKSGQVPKTKKRNERCEKRLLHLISNPNQHILTQLDSMANNITLQFCLFFFCYRN